MRCRSLRRALVFAAASVIAIAVHAAEKVKRYDIRGATARELREALNLARPVGADGSPHDGLTTWKIVWQYKTLGRGSQCEVASYEITLDLETTLPRWVNEKDAPQELVERWRAYLTGLEAHEAGHKTIGGQAVVAVRDVLVAMRPQLGCDVLRDEVSRAVSQTLARFKERNRLYDVETDHGRTQGARFP